ncbi:MAG: preprotein translocase subunit SecE [Candidatus Niyogibacteria bacterium CG10_big_fil_rev_8_21_14_0_10_46_36]|uniref:Protein translocase subunit SecE n=1 Tax=Candidatus Niyogibacteria bacterium CG10_big_fil_rev_8_21_14_0_10_46_36 TaxID=1974726 RepID=A0A2H0TEP1_9BACT|nr:MAG: preprotein translocase subunit SecE [Candidatus Niyogibacteria bacterium CG10_big_fil_rev_8_21_14_0_10_46_36]
MQKLVDYVKGSRLELKQVTWPTRAETTRYTILVIGISIAIALFLGVLDFAFTSILEVLL